MNFQQEERINKQLSSLGDGFKEAAEKLNLAAEHFRRFPINPEDLDLIKLQLRGIQRELDNVVRLNKIRVNVNKLFLAVTLAFVAFFMLSVVQIYLDDSWFQPLLYITILGFLVCIGFGVWNLIKSING